MKTNHFTYYVVLVSSLLIVLSFFVANKSVTSLKGQDSLLKRDLPTFCSHRLLFHITPGCCRLRNDQNGVLLVFQRRYKCSRARFFFGQRDRPQTRPPMAHPGDGAVLPGVVASVVQRIGTTGSIRTEMHDRGPRLGPSGTCTVAAPLSCILLRCPPIRAKTKKNGCP